MFYLCYSTKWDHREWTVNTSIWYCSRFCFSASLDEGSSGASVLGGQVQKLWCLKTQWCFTDWTGFTCACVSLIPLFCSHSHPHPPPSMAAWRQVSRIQSRGGLKFHLSSIRMKNEGGTSIWEKIIWRYESSFCSMKTNCMQAKKKSQRLVVWFGKCTHWILY